MRSFRRIAIASALLFFALSLPAEGPMWSKKAISFPAWCGDSDLQRCKPLRIDSPDGKKFIQVTYRKVEDEFDARIRVADLHGHGREIGSLGNVQLDLQWASDSKALFVNGSDGGATTGMFVRVYRIEGLNLRRVPIANLLWHDMMKLFPPCRDSMIDRQTCKEITAYPGFNLSGIDWLPDSSAVVIMAEIPCTSYYGAVMCQVMGYEVNVATGKISRRMSAAEFKKRWQPSMAWEFRVPEPPLR